MTDSQYHLLAVEDNPDQLRLIRDLFTLHPAARNNFLLTTVERLADALQEVAKASFDAALVDLNLPDSTGVDTFRKLHAAAPDMPIAIWSAHVDERVALGAVRAGAQEYLLKGEVSPTQLLRTMRHIIERARLHREALAAQARADSANRRVIAHIETMSAGFLALDNDYRVTYVNAAVEQMSGLSREQMVGRIIWDVFPDTVGTVFYENARIAIEERRPVSYEAYYPRLDLWVAVRAYPDEDGVFSYVTDITASKRFQTEIAERERHIRAILDSTPDCVKLIDVQGVVTEMNAAGLELLEATSADVVGHSICNFVVPEHHERMNSLIADVFTGARGTVEFEIIGKLGTRRWVSMRAAPLRGNDDRIIAALAITRDVSQQKRTERALQESEEYFRLLVDNLSDAVALTDPKGKILYISNVSEQILGFKPEEVIGRICWDFVHPDDAPGLQTRALERLEGDDKPAHSEVRMRHADGEWRFIQVRARLYPGGRYGEPDLLVTLRDITESKRIEQDLERAQDQLLHVQKLEAVGRLAGGVAHDFNNLLTAIGGHADLLLEQVANDAAARAELEEIKHGVGRAAALTRQLLAFSRKQMLQPVVLDLNTVVNDMRKLLSRLIGENIDLVTMSTTSDAAMTADRGQIEQVIMNLVVNARDAMPRGGRVTLTTKLCNVTETQPHRSGAAAGEYVCISVADTGGGMGKEVLDHIFEPFYTTKEIGKGTGLGLATVYGIVKQSGGYIDVYSTIGEGTRFELLFPHVELHRVRTQLPIRTGPEQPGTGSILIVEDEKAVRNVACRVLRRAGYDVIAANDGMDALEIGEDRLAAIDLVLTDVVMPRLNGPELVARLRAMRPELRVLFTSGYTDAAAFPQGAIGVGVAFLEKPFTPASLLEAVRSAIQHD